MDEQRGLRRRGNVGKRGARTDWFGVSSGRGVKSGSEGAVSPSRLVVAVPVGLVVAFGGM